MSAGGVLAWMRLTTSDSANTVHWAFIGMLSAESSEALAKSASSMSRARLMASTNAPAPAAHFSLMAKSTTFPLSPSLIARASSAPTSMTVLAAG